MTNTQVVLKPGGLAVVAALAAAVLGIGVIGVRGRSHSLAGAAVGAAPKLQFDSDPSMSPGEIRDKELITSLNSSGSQKRDWLFLGPLLSGSAIVSVSNTKDDETKMRQIIGTSYLPTETKYQARENATVTVGKVTYHWRKVQGSAFDFKQMFASKETPITSLSNVVVYGYTTIESQGAAKKRLRFRSDDGAIVWVNGQKVYTGDQIRGIETAEDVVPIELRPGRNNILVKVGQGTGGWGMSFQLEDVR